MCAKFSQELEAVGTHEVGLPMAHTLGTTRHCEGLRTEQRAESKRHVMQCVRESHREPDEEESTN